MSEDWLALPIEPPKRHPALEPLYDDVTPAQKRTEIVVPPGVDPKYHGLVVALRKLRPRQRTYLRALAAHGFDHAKARRDLADRFTPVDASTVFRWSKSPIFKAAYQALQEHLFELSGIDPVGLLLRVNHVAEDAMTPVPILHQGEDTGFREVDRTNALRALELLGKHRRLWGSDEKTTRVTVQIVELDGPKRGDEPPAIEGEAEEVPY